jgi:ABC-type glycerol-3-phosphate transport system substrate-binding protein
MIERLRHARRSTSCVIVLGLFLAGQPQFTSAAFAADKLRVWLVLNLPAVSTTDELPPLDAFLETWSRRGIDLYGLRTKANANVDFRRQLVGQTEILNQLGRFKASHPAVPPIEVTFFGWDEYWDSIQAEIGNPRPVVRPDVVQVPTTWCSSLAEGLDFLAPLHDDAARDAARRYAPQLLEPCLVYGAGPLYGLPWLVDIRVLYFWKADLPALDAELRNSRQVRDSFREVLQSSQSSAGHPLMALPTARDWELLHQTALLAWGAGGDLVTTRRLGWYHRTSASLRDPVLDGAKYLSDLARDRLIALPRETRQDLEQQFVNHQLGSVMSGPWLERQLRAREDVSLDAIGVTIPPLYERTPVTFVGGSLLGMTGASPALAAPALTLIEYLSRGDAALPTAIAIGLLPASTAARGTAAAAVQKRDALSRGAPCTTYFECLLASGATVSFVTTLEAALAVGRTYPPLPDWWRIEVPSHLGSLYHFWQEIAALQPRDSLAASLKTVSDEWDSSLLAFDRWLWRGMGTTAGALALGYFIVLRVRRGRRELIRRQQQLEAVIEELESQQLKPTPSPVDEATVNARALELLKGMLADTTRQRDPKPSDPVTACVGGHRLEIVLPTHAERRLSILQAGAQSETVESMPARMIELVVRRALLTGRRKFSLCAGALEFWPTPQELPQNRGARWEALVADMRRALGPKGLQVISKGKNTIYEFMLDETDYECWMTVNGGRQRFVTVVRDPFARAGKLATTDRVAALVVALDAYSAERTLMNRDVEVVLRVCQLGAAATLTESQRTLLSDAQVDLARWVARYRLFFASYPTPESLLQPRVHRSSLAAGDLDQHWDELRRTLDELEQAAIGLPPVPPALPAAVDKAWHVATALVRTHGRNAAQRDARFSDAYATILEYWGDKTRDEITSLIDIVARLDPKGKRKHRLREGLRNALPEALLAALAGDDKSFLSCTLERALLDHLWRSLGDDSSHVLLEITANGDESKQRRLAALLKTQAAPPDFRTCIEMLIVARQRLDSDPAGV